ncbi:MAG: hypothetical protein JNJ60_08060 [Rhodocyclaceae bacterium]|nr:hypothetical protein [Rhodocyclaceae bacterium]
MDAGSEIGALSGLPAPAADQALAAAAIASLLEQGTRFDTLSNWLGVLGLAVLASGVFYLPGTDSFDARWWCAVVLLGLLQKYFALRVGLDARLFAQLGQRLQAMAADTALAEFDRALQCAGLRKVRAGPTRSLADRCRGARRLLRLQLCCTLLQCLLFLYLGVIAAGSSTAGETDAAHELYWQVSAEAVHVA